MVTGKQIEESDEDTNREFFDSLKRSGVIVVTLLDNSDSDQALSQAQFTWEVSDFIAKMLSI